MTKLLKILLWTFASLVLVVLLAAILIPVLVDPNDFKSEITQQVYNQTGRTLSIEGDIDLSISLPLSVSLELGHTELSNAEGFADTPFARMRGASLHVAIWPLLTENRLDVGEIKLTGMELNLIKNKQGVTNWDDLSAKETASTDSTPPKATDNEASDTRATPEINVAGLTISDAQISWTDEQANQIVHLSKTNISISELIEDKPFDLKLSTDIDSNNPAIKGTFTISSSPVISLSKQNFKLPETLLTLDLTGDMLPGGATKTSLGGDISFDGQAQTLDISNMKLTSYDMVINGLLQASQLDSSPQYSGQVSIDKFSPEKLAIALGAEQAQIKQAKAFNSADAKLTFKGDDKNINLSSLAANLGDLSLKGSLAVQDFQAPKYNGQIELGQFSPKKLASALGAALPEMKQAQALSSADANMTFKGNQNQVHISSLEANLDKTALKGTATIKNFDKPHYGFNLTLNQLDLDYYALAEQAETNQGAAKATATSPSATKTANAGTSPIFPVETLRQLNLNGKLTIAQFIASGAKMTNVVIVLKGKDGLVQLAPLKANLYQGNINLNTNIDARGKTPKLKINNVLKNVQIGDLLQATTGSSDLTGVANITANITSVGNDTDRLIKNSNGTGKLLVTDGRIKQLDILTTLRQAQALYRGTTPPTDAQDKNTKFSELKGSFKIVNGVVKNNDLSSQSPVMVLTGAGYADLPKEYLDYTLKVKLLDSLKIDKESQGTDFSGKEFPYTIKGKFSELSEEVNISKVLEQEVKRKAVKEINKKLEEKLEEKLGEKFKGLLKF